MEVFDIYTHTECYQWGYAAVTYVFDVNISYVRVVNSPGYSIRSPPTVYARIFLISFRVMNFIVLVPITVPFPYANHPISFHVAYNDVSHKF